MLYAWYANKIAVMCARSENPPCHYASKKRSWQIRETPTAALFATRANGQQLASGRGSVSHHPRPLVARSGMHDRRGNVGGLSLCETFGIVATIMNTMGIVEEAEQEPLAMGCMSRFLY